MIGTVIAGRYRIDQPVGRGGFAWVYRGFDLQLKRTVGIKLFNARMSGPGISARICTEREAQARLNHPHIAVLHDCGEHEGAPYLVMEFVEGRPLAAGPESPPWAWATVLPIASQICDAMAHAHDRGVVHRDLSLNNIMVLEGNEIAIKIVDFGLSKVFRTDETVSLRELVGTFSYMAPEQIRGDDVDGRTDIFAFGVGLYRLLNGRYPFAAEHPTAIMYLIQNQPRAEHLPAVPPGVRELIDTCLNKTPENRFQSFKDIAVVLTGLDAATTPATQSVWARPPIQVATSRNPYLNRVMIRNPNDFFGREREIRKIYARLDSQHPQSISIVGDRRIGKSSLLNYIYQRQNRQRHMQHSESTVFVYLDLQSQVQHDKQEFIDVLLNLVHYETGSYGATGHVSSGLDRLNSCVRQLQQGGNRIVILMDEFEVITSNPEFEASFFSFLRALANNYKVAFVTTSRDELQLMCHNQDIADSPFFNIFSNLPLRAFEEAEARQLIADPSDNVGVPLGPHAAEILKLAGLFPLYLQIACSAVFEELALEPSHGPNWTRVRDVFMEEVKPHYDYLLDKFDTQERSVLELVAASKAVPRKLGYVGEELTRRGYVIEAAGGAALFAESFREYLLSVRGRRGGPGSLFSRLLGGKQD